MRRMLSVPIRPDQHTWIKQQAGRRGIRMQDLMVEILDAAMAQPTVREDGQGRLAAIRAQSDTPVRRSLESVDILAQDYPTP